MNAIYDKDAVRLLLNTAQKHDVPLLFVTNNVCNQMLKFEDASEVIEAMNLKGLMQQLAVAWYGPHLKGETLPVPRHSASWSCLRGTRVSPPLCQRLAIPIMNVEGLGLCTSSASLLLVRMVPLSDTAPALCTSPGKCVPFDWVAFCAMLLHKRYPSLMKLEKRELWFGPDDASIMVLDDPQLERTPTVLANLEGTQKWGVVDSLVAVDRDAMLQLARSLASGV